MSLDMLGIDVVKRVIVEFGFNACFEVVYKW